MPQLDPIYKSRIDVPERTGQPHIPASSGSYAPVTEGAERLTRDLSYLYSLTQYRQSRMDEVEQTNTAGQVIMQARDRVVGLMNELRDPEHPQYRTLSPRQKKDVFSQEVRNVFEQSLKAGRQIGNIGAEYVSTHLPVFLSAHVESFNKELDALYHEDMRFRVHTTVAQFQKDTIDQEVGLKELPKRLEYLDALLHTNVRGGILSPKEATDIRNDFIKKTLLTRSLTRIKENPHDFLLANPEEYVSAGLDPNDVKWLFDQAYTYISRKQREKEADERAIQEAYERQSETNFGDLLRQIMSNQIRTTDQLLAVTATMSIKPQHLDHLRSIVEQVAHAPKQSDPQTLFDMRRTLLSFDPKNWVTYDEIERAFRDGKLSVNDALQLSEARRHNEARERDDQDSMYKEMTAKAERSLNVALQSITGGPFDLSKQGTVIASAALSSFHEQINKNRTLPHAERVDPFIISNRVASVALRQAIQAGISLLHSYDFIKAFPVDPRTGQHVVDKHTLFTLYRQGKIDAATLSNSVQLLMLIEHWDAQSKAHETLQAPTETEGGRGRPKKP